MSPLEFCFDFISPYAYVAWARIGELAARHGRVLEPVPVLFAGLLGAHGQKGPVEIPAKRLYTYKDVVRKAHAWGVPLAPPASHPFNPLLPLRVASLAMPREARVRLVDVLYRALWCSRLDATDRTAVARACDEAGLDGARLVEEAGGEDAKLRLRAQTDEAIGRGVFGVPTAIADGELFWGTESLVHLEAFLEGRDPFGAEEAAAWGRHQPSATRRGLGR